MVDCLALMLSGDVLGSIQCTFTNSIGLWIFALVFLWISALIYIKTQNGIAVSIFGIFLSSIIMYYNAFGAETIIAMYVVLFIITISIAALVYSIIFKRSPY